MIRLRPITLAVLLSISTSAHADCDEPSQRADLALGVERATQAFRQLDRAGFAQARDTLQAQIPCLAEPLQPGDAASIHGLMALSAFLDKDDGRSVASLSAAVRSQPDFALPADLFPDGHPLRLHLQVARSLQPGNLRPLPQPPTGAVSVDGAPATGAPGDRPSVLQWTEDKLEVRDTAYLGVGDPMPAWGPMPSPSSTEPRHPWRLVAATGGAAALAGGMVALAGSRHGRFLDSGTPYAELPGLQRQANGLTIAAGVSGAAALGFGAAAVVRW